ncbi:hypothetical protein CLOM_g9880 [Closterium sp. NIES-68]|nr:hypothetical protein CLOM_g9880 [Closterium sp. NIES-68]GJP75927.1 hypothetical protein CLOP_g6325 [Closterium sp. NIES-67]
MDDLISLGETLQQASSALVGDDIQADPRSGSAPVIQLLVVGAPGSGKSAVLNTLIGHAVLPTGEGGCTRFPVLVDLHRDQNLSAGAVRGNLGARTNMPKPSEIRQALQSDMSKAKGSSRNREEAQLILRSPIAPPMRIIDLPGVEKASQMDGAFQDNVSNNDAVILVVVSATAVKDSLKILRIAHDIDREGVRTIGVITKFDQVVKDRDAAKLAVDLLQRQGAAMAQDYPWVAVIGQPLGDKDTNEPMDGAWQEEFKVLSQVMRANGVKGMDTPMGRDALLRLIARTVRHKMKEKIPRIMSALEGRSQEVDAELLRLGDSLISSLNGSRALALELCRGFENKFCEHLDGSEGGGSQMVEKFVGTLPLRFRGLPLDDTFSFDNVKKVVMEADGYQPYLLSPEKGLRLLIKRSLELAKQPGIDCVDEVHKILVDIVAAAASQAPSLVRFPPMKRELVAIASAALDEYRAEAKRMVTAIVDMEKGFVPPAHFIEAEYKRQEKLWRDLEVARKGLQDRGVLSRSLTGDSGGGRFTSAMSSFSRKKEPPPPPPSVDASQPLGPVKELAGFLWKVSSKGGWSKRWFALSDKTARLYYVKKPDEKTPRGVIPLEDCIVDEIVPPEEVPSASDMKAGSNPSAQALSFKIGNKVPYKTVVKVHQSLILRADNMAEKQQWVARLRSHTKAFKDAPPPPPASGDAENRAEDGGGREGDSTATSSSGSGSSGGSNVPGAIGQGGVGVGGQQRVANPEEELKYQVTEVRRYVQAVLVHLADNIPKAIVLAQVERARDSMLTKLYQTVSAISDVNLQALLQEDAESQGKRDKFKRMRDAMLQLKRALSLHEARASAEEEGQGTKETVDAWRAAFNKASHATASIPEDHPSSDSGTLPSPSTRKSPPPPPSSSSSSSSSKPSKSSASAAVAAAAAAASPTPPASSSAAAAAPTYAPSQSSSYQPSRSSSTSQQPPAVTRGMSMSSVPNPLGPGVGGAVVPGPVMARGPPMMPSGSAARSASPLRQTLAGGMDGAGGMGGMGNSLRATSRRVPPPPPTGFSYK